MSQYRKELLIPFFGSHNLTAWVEMRWMQCNRDSATQNLTILDHRRWISNEQMKDTRHASHWRETSRSLRTCLELWFALKAASKYHQHHQFAHTLFSYPCLIWSIAVCKIFMTGTKKLPNCAIVQNLKWDSTKHYIITRWILLCSIKQCGLPFNYFRQHN